ncbi:hypothetical protein ACJIZ3_002351 [Penstemon smallii]|uniref:BHLH domain-containing protein n=1 Tax=Penstemon smallii TaxID=265156 RepID=A0ABD3U900_9LAMI
MDSSAFCWISEMGLDSSIFTDQSDFMDSLDEELAAALRQDLENCLSTQNNFSTTSSSSTNLVNYNIIPTTTTNSSMASESEPEPPHKLQKPNNFSNFQHNNTADINNNNNNNNNSSIILNFGHSTEDPPQHPNSRALNPDDQEAALSQVLNNSQPAVMNNNNNNNNNNPDQEQLVLKTVKKTSRVRPPSQTYDHIIAERKRREQLSQRFVALSSIVPGLKKMDKTSVLGDAIKYLKQLQERVKMLEEQSTKQTMESVVLVRKSQMIIMAEDDEGSSGEESGSSDIEQPLPEIEARVCKNHILLRVHCEKQKGVLINLLSKVEGLSLAVINTNVIPFGTLALDITIIAEMEQEFNSTVKNIVKELRSSLLPKDYMIS